MEMSISYGEVKLQASVCAVENATVCVLFLSGGSLDVGRERYGEWQDGLARDGVSSLSFDYSGVNGSGTPLEKSSLRLRIKEAVCVADWMEQNISAHRYILYGVSMGGYIALGLVKERAKLFDALILHAPAAYSSKSHDLYFGKEFTSEIRREYSWKDSLSFGWFQSYTNPVLLIEAENDEVIPKPIIEKYRSIKKDGKLTTLPLKNTPHEIWGDSEAEKTARAEIYRGLVDFTQR